MTQSDTADASTKATDPEPYLFLPSDAKLSVVDAELHALSTLYWEKATLARQRAKRHRARGDLVRWRKANAVARVWELAHFALWDLACPF